MRESSVPRLTELVSETKKKTLEEIAAAFGDCVVDVEERDIAAEEAVMDAKVGAQHVDGVRGA
jgi:hypothetical protein